MQVGLQVWRTCFNTAVRGRAVRPSLPLRILLACWALEASDPAQEMTHLDSNVEEGQAAEVTQIGVDSAKKLDQHHAPWSSLVFRHVASPATLSPMVAIQFGVKNAHHG